MPILANLFKSEARTLSQLFEEYLERFEIDVFVASEEDFGQKSAPTWPRSRWEKRSRWACLQRGAVHAWKLQESLLAVGSASSAGQGYASLGKRPGYSSGHSGQAPWVDQMCFWEYVEVSRHPKARIHGTNCLWFERDRKHPKVRDRITAIKTLHQLA